MDQTRGKTGRRHGETVVVQLGSKVLQGLDDGGGRVGELQRGTERSLKGLTARVREGRTWLIREKDPNTSASSKLGQTGGWWYP